MADSSFEDDEDDLLLLQLLKQTQSKPSFTPPEPTLNQTPSQPTQTNASTASIEPELFRAQGEISILRAQIASLQNLKSDEVARLKRELTHAKQSASGQISALKQNLDRLEDEKKFLNNEIKAFSLVKRRKLPSTKTSANFLPSASVSVPSKPTTIQPKAVHIDDEWSQFTSHIWHYTINGSDRSSIEFLSRIALEMDVSIGPDLCILSNTPILLSIMNYLMSVRILRLDAVVYKFSELVLLIIEKILSIYLLEQTRPLLCVPFLLSLVYAAITFKSSAVTEELSRLLIVQLCKVLKQFMFVLQLENEEEETFVGRQNITPQQRLLENFTLLVSLDLLEAVVSISTQLGEEATSKFWKGDVLDLELLQSILPENTDRFISSVQINTIYNFVEMLSLSLSNESFGTRDEKVNRLMVKSLFKVFLMDIPLKEDFLFYGLNRLIGNNHDFARVSASIPKESPKFLNQPFVTFTCVVEPVKFDRNEKFRIDLLHDFHLLNLRVRAATLLETIAVFGGIGLINLKENIKLIVRIIEFEQNHIMQQPRYQYVYLRLQIISVMVRILHYIINEHKIIDALIYPETLYELFVVLMRISFGFDSLGSEAQSLLHEIRGKGNTDISIFNRWCELRSRETAHFNEFNSQLDKFRVLAEVEGDFPNGLEFPYDSDTIEVAREILGLCVNHDEADNLYYNMIGPEG